MASSQISETELKIVYFDILNGYTKIDNSILGKDLYVKHLNVFDSIGTDKDYKKSFNRAKGLGIPTEEEQLKYLAKEDLWTDEREGELTELKGALLNLEQTKSQLFLKSQIESIKEEISETQQQIDGLTLQRAELMGMTAEIFASKKANEGFMLKVLYDDEKFQTPALPEEKYDSLSDQKLNELMAQYSVRTKNLSMGQLRKIAISTFFVNFFYLAEDNPYTFYGKPIVQLTYYQSELFALGRYFKHLASEAKTKPPPEIAEDPEKLIEFYETRKNAEEFMEKNEARSKHDGSGGTSIVGATQEDLQNMGYSKAQQGVDLHKYAASKGGSLNMQDFIELHS